jgi:hypothetical protein
MSLEVLGFNSERDGQVVAAASFATADFCAAQGMPSAEAYTTGDRAGQYAAEIIFASLSRMGVWPPKGFEGDAESAFIATTKQITLESGAVDQRLS